MRSQGKTGRARFHPPTRKNNTALVVGGVAGGLLLLIVIIAVAASKPGQQPQEVRQDAPVVAPKVNRDRSVSETGAIMFVCGGSARHEDKEVVLSRCPHCPAGSRFYWNGGQYLCQACGQPFDNADVKCPECGKVPRVHRIKHR